MSLKNAYINGSEAKRLPKYFRCLRQCLLNGEIKISSVAISKMIGTTPSQVRADLNEFSGTGLQGYGYNVKQLYTEISKKLGVGDNMSAVIVVGEEKDASYLIKRLEGRGLTVTEVVTTENAAERLRYSKADIAVITECDDISSLTEALKESSFKGVWNLTICDIDLDIPVLNLPIGDIVMTLMCEIKKGGEQ